MRKRNQLADLRRLISLSSRDMKRQYVQYIYEDTSAVLLMLFGLTHEQLNKLEKNNTLTLLRYLLDGSDEFHASIPDWMVSELNVFIRNPSFTDHEKALVLSTFDPEELFDRVLTFEQFVQRFMDIKESFEDYIVREIKNKRTGLYDIFVTIRDKTKHNVILSMINDLKDSKHSEAVALLELFTYIENPDLSSAAFHAVRESRSRNTVPVLYSISKLNPLFSEEAQSACIEMIKANPVYRKNRTRDTEVLDIGISLADGTGTFSAIIGRRMRRNDYFFANILFKTRVGMKEASLTTSLTGHGYREIIRKYKDKLHLYRIDEQLFKKILKHFISVGMQTGFGVPVEIIALKNILGWMDIEPEKFALSGPGEPDVPYSLEDLEKFPLDTWWLHDNRVYNMLSPYRQLDLAEIPENVLIEIAGQYSDYAKSELIPLCDLSAAIVCCSGPFKGKRLTGVFRTIKKEILNPPTDPLSSLFLSYQTINTIYHTLQNLNSGMSSVEFS